MLEIRKEVLFCVRDKKKNAPAVLEINKKEEAPALRLLQGYSKVSAVLEIRERRPLLC